MRKAIISIVTIICFISCSYRRHDVSLLISIDSLLAQEQTDSALMLIEHFNPSDLDEDLSAYYHLLLTQSRYKAYEPIYSDSTINLAINYYESARDLDKLARCYFYKSGILCDLNREKEALDYLKKAELLAEHSDNFVLQHNICFFISSINADYQEMELALKYAKKALECSEHTGKHEHLVHDYEKLFVLYNSLGYKDSCLYYVDHCIQLLNSMSADSPFLSAPLWGNLGVAYSSINPEKAEQFLEKANSLRPQDNVFGQLADIKLEKGDTIKATELLNEGFRISENLRFKAKIAKLLSKLEQESGRYEQANIWLKQAQELKDSLTRQQREDNILAQQIVFDKTVEQEKDRGLLAYALFAIGIILFGSGFTAWYLRRRERKLRQGLLRQMNSVQQELEAAQEHLAATSDELRQSARQLRSTSNMLNRLEKERKEEHKEQRQRARMLENGHKCYTDLMSGGSTIFWQRKDFTDFIDYYRMAKPRFAEDTDRQYKKLTPNQAVYLILKDMGKSDQETMEQMKLTPGAYYTMHSRIKEEVMQTGEPIF